MKCQNKSQILVLWQVFNNCNALCEIWTVKEGVFCCWCWNLILEFTVSQRRWSFMIGISYCGSEVYSFDGHIRLWHWKEGTEHRIVVEGGWYSFLFVWLCLTPLSTIFQLYRGGWFRLWLVGRLFESYLKLWIGEYGLFCIVAWGMWNVLIGVAYCVSKVYCYERYIWLWLGHYWWVCKPYFGSNNVESRGGSRISN